MGISGCRILFLICMVDDVLLARLPLHLRRLAILWMHDRLFLRGPILLHRVCDCLSAQLRQGSRTVVYAYSFFLVIPYIAVCTDVITRGVKTVYVEQAFGGDDFEPDLFPTDLIEKEWEPDADRASIYKAALPDLLRNDGSEMA